MRQAIIAPYAVKFKVDSPLRGLAFSLKDTATNAVRPWTWLAVKYVERSWKESLIIEENASACPLAPNRDAIRGHRRETQGADVNL